MNVQEYWYISIVFISALALLAGMASKYKHPLGILIDNRNRYSLNRLQITGWSLLIISSFVALFLSSYTVPAISQTLLGLMGISVSSTVTAGAVKANKDVGGAMIQMSNDSDNKRRFMQVLLEEEGSESGLVSVTKFQNLIFTFVLWILYIVLFVKSDPKTLPEFPAEALWLIGISHVGYVSWKIPTKK
jgi:hypothetical protein